jgi:hypothetical protein
MTTSIPKVSVEPAILEPFLNDVVADGVVPKIDIYYYKEKQMNVGTHHAHTMLWFLL